MRVGGAIRVFRTLTDGIAGNTVPRENHIRKMDFRPVQSGVVGNAIRDRPNTGERGISLSGPSSVPRSDIRPDANPRIQSGEIATLPIIRK